MKVRLIGLAVAAFACAAGAENQVWNDGGSDNVWCTNAANWDAGSVWTNGNSAVFFGAGGTLLGETIDIAATVTVANITFLTNNYVIADTNADGSLSFVGGPSVVTVANAADTGTISEVIDGANGFTKAGAGVLQLKGTNTYTGITRVSAGTLRLNPSTPAALGATGTSNQTIVEDGATLDLNGAFMSNDGAETISITGSGCDGKGALINTGGAQTNHRFGYLTMQGDTMIGGTGRIDLYDVINGGGHAFTKSGSLEVGCYASITNGLIIVNSGDFIMMNNACLGSADYDTIVNGGRLLAYWNYTTKEHIIVNGGAIGENAPNWTLILSGRVTLNSNVTVFAAQSTSAFEMSGVLEGNGGITCSGGVGPVYITGASNTYSGATSISGLLCLGRPTLYAGSLGTGVVTNNGTVYCYSGRLGSGNFVNKNYLYFDATNSFAISNNLLGTGTSFVRYGGRMTMNGNVSSNGSFRLSSGGLTLTNGANFYVGAEFTIADRLSSNYPVDPTNVTAALNIADGTLLSAYAFIIGNGNTVGNGGMTGVVNQIGGTVRTFGWNGDPVTFPGERDGLRIAHYGQSRGTYNMMGGTLRVENGYRLTVATEGIGYFHQTGGEVFTPQLIVNDRSGGGGYGHLLLEGGVLNVGSNGITAGTGAPYLVEYGGAGGVVRAGTNFASSLNATLLGSGTNAVTFDTTNWTVTLSGKLSGTGGLSKAGSGTLVLSGTNTYSGVTRVLEGTLQLAAACVGPTGTVAFAVSANGVGGVLAVPDGFSLAGMTVAVANPESLDTGRNYTVASWSGNLAAPFGASALPGSWYVYYDWENKTAQLRAAIGTVIRLR
jgi:autotransporter-associated beta strand protein